MKTQLARLSVLQQVDWKRHKDALITAAGVTSILVMTLVFLYR